MGAATSPRGRLPAPLLALTVAGDFAGLTESGGDDRGPGVEWILAAAGLPAGAPWCAAFVNRMAEVACAIADVVSPLESIPLSEQGLVQAYVDHGKAAGWLVTWEEASAGDLFCLRFGSSGYHHMGFVDLPDRDSRTFSTLEGNTNDDGSRNGFEVLRRVRPHRPSNVYLRWWKGAS